MRKRNTLLLAAVSVFTLTMATTTNAAYQCTWTDGVKVCGNELGFAPSVGGESDRRDQHSGDHDSGGGSGGASSDGGDGGDGGDDGDSGSGGNGGGQGNNGGGNGGDDGSPNGKDDKDR